MDPRIEYIKSHPEIKHLTTMFIAEIIYSQPENIREFGKVFFSIPEVKNFAARLAGFDSYDHHMKFIVNQQLKSLMDADAVGRTDDMNDYEFQSGAQLLDSFGKEEAASDARMTAIINNMRLSRAQTQITEQITKEQVNRDANNVASNNVSCILNVGRIPYGVENIDHFDTTSHLSQSRFMGVVQGQLNSQMDISNTNNGIYVGQKSAIQGQSQYGQQYISQQMNNSGSLDQTVSFSQIYQQGGNQQEGNLTINQLQHWGNRSEALEDIQISQGAGQMMPDGMRGSMEQFVDGSQNRGQIATRNLITPLQLTALKQLPQSTIDDGKIVAMVFGQKISTENISLSNTQLNTSGGNSVNTFIKNEDKTSEKLGLLSDQVSQSQKSQDMSQITTQQVNKIEQASMLLQGKIVRLNGVMTFLDESGRLVQLVGADGAGLSDEAVARLGPGQLERLLVQQAGAGPHVFVQYLNAGVSLSEVVAAIEANVIARGQTEQGNSQYMPVTPIIGPGGSQGHFLDQGRSPGRFSGGISPRIPAPGSPGINGSVVGSQAGTPGAASSATQVPGSPSAPAQPVDPALRALQEAAARLGRLAEFGRQGIELSRFTDLGVSMVFTPTFQELGSDFQKAAVYQVLAGHLARSPRIMRAGGFQLGFKSKILFQPDVIGIGVTEYQVGIKNVQEHLPGTLMVMTNLAQDVAPWVPSQLQQLRGAGRGVRWLAGRFNITSYDGLFRYIPLIFKGNYAKGPVEDFCMILVSFVAPHSAQAKLEATYSAVSVPEIKRSQIKQRDIEEIAEKAKKLNQVAESALLEYLIQQSHAKATRDKRLQKQNDLSDSDINESMRELKSSQQSVEKLRQIQLDYADFSDITIDIRELNRFITQQKQQIQAEWIKYYQQKNAIPQSQLPDYPPLDPLRYDSYFYEPYEEQYDIDQQEEKSTANKNNPIPNVYNQLLFPVHQIKVKETPILSDDHKGVRITQYVVQQILAELKTQVPTFSGCGNRNVIEEVQCMLKEVNMTISRENIFICTLSSQQVFNYRDFDRNQTAIIRVNSQSQVYSNPFLYYEAVWQYGRISQMQQQLQNSLVQSTKSNLNQSISHDTSHNPVFQLQNQYIQKRFFDGRVIRRGFINSQIYMSVVNFKNIERREESMTLVNNCIPDIPIDGSYVTQQHYINPIISMLIQLQFETKTHVIDFQAVQITYFQQISQLVILKSERHMKHVTNYLLQTLLQRLIFKLAEKKDLDIQTPTMLISYYSLYNLSILESQTDNFFNQQTNPFLDAVFVPNIHQYNCKAAFPSWYEDTAQLWLVQMTLSDLKALLVHFRDCYSFDRLVKINVPFRPLCGQFSLVDDKLVNQDILKLKLLQRMIVSADPASISRQSLETNYNVINDDDKLKEDIYSSITDDSSKKPISVIVDQFMINSVLWRDVSDQIKLRQDKMVKLDMKLSDIAIAGKTEDVDQLYFGV